MNCGLNFIAPIVAAYQHHAVSRLAPLVQNPDDIAASQIDLDAGQ
jgi:hypothetical protein